MFFNLEVVLIMHMFLLKYCFKVILLWNCAILFYYHWRCCVLFSLFDLFMWPRTRAIHLKL